MSASTNHASQWTGWADRQVPQQPTNTPASRRRPTGNRIAESLFAVPEIVVGAAVAMMRVIGRATAGLAAILLTVVAVLLPVVVMAGILQCAAVLLRL